MKTFINAVILFFIAINFTNAQTGTLAGSIKNVKTSETLTGATVKLLELTSAVTFSDIDGHYLLEKIPAGFYTMEVTYVGFNDKKVSDVEINANTVTTLDITLLDKENTFKGFTLETDAKKETIGGLTIIQQNNSIIMDVLSAETMKQNPVTSSADAIKKINGVTIQDNKFAIIRGLSDRYNLAMLGNSELPSTEPDRKTFSFDIVPGNLLDNMMIYKTAQPDLPGDFAGGVIQLNTKDIPDKSFISLNLGSGYNTISTFSPYSTYQGGKKDWLGIDDGTRAIPAACPMTDSFEAYTIARKVEVSKLFSNNWKRIDNPSSPLAESFQLAGGIRKKLGKNDLGTIFALTYNTSEKFTSIYRSNYDNADTSTYNYKYTDNQYRRNVSWGGLWNVSFKLGKNNKFTLRNIYNVTSDNTTTTRTGETRDFYVKRDGYEFLSNTLFNSQLSGEHFIPSNKIKIKWGVSTSTVKRDLPDLRKTYYYKNIVPNSPDDTVFNAYVPLGSSSNPDVNGRFWSNLQENVKQANADVSIPFKLYNNTQTVKAGFYLQQKNRTFDARVMGYTIPNPNKFFWKHNLDYQTFLSQPAELLFTAANMSDSGFALSEITSRADFYTASSNENAVFLMLDNKLSKHLRIVWGARMEMFSQQLTSSYSNGDTLEIKSHPGDTAGAKADLLPSLNLTYALTTKANFRISVSKTVSRPEFRELAPFAFYDFTNAVTLVGNPKLKRTDILNADFRLEKFFGNGQLITASVFYKKFTNPIEKSIDAGSSGAGSTNETFYNIPVATNYGAEFELRKNFDFVSNIIKSKVWEKFTFNTNLAYINSIVKVNDTITRPLQGQSPYIINVGFSFNDYKSGTVFNITYNKIGRRIDDVGGIGYFDIYENPRPQLDFTVNKKFLKNGNIKLSFGDILQNDVIFYQDVDKDGAFTNNPDLLITKKTVGANYSVAVSYKF